ncbi:2920_t:CDS:2 [Ambispora leptoticha]|uniref:2918_t:CDS:1 n=1 Tax=Ambispora leptoticha TaxID=144679 RepID=A0A9N9AVI6_9GLOM|nr:2918_t:CDS:2 [Ambispora leptoticha]CAG8543192.1 2920_t:CDS:2 [Ambispora leptoticha]
MPIKPIKRRIYSASTNYKENNKSVIKEHKDQQNDEEKKYAKIKNQRNKKSKADVMKFTMKLTTIYIDSNRNDDTKRIGDDDDENLVVIVDDEDDNNTVNNPSNNDDIDENLNEWLTRLMESQSKFQAVADAASQIADGFEKFANSMSLLCKMPSTQHNFIIPMMNLVGSNSINTNLNHLNSNINDYNNNIVNNKHKNRQQQNVNLYEQGIEQSQSMDGSKFEQTSDSENYFSSYSSSSKRIESSSAYVSSPSSISSYSMSSAHMNRRITRRAFNEDDRKGREWTLNERAALTRELIKCYRRRRNLTQSQLCEEIISCADQDIGIKLNKVISAYLNLKSLPIRPSVLEATKRWVDKENVKRRARKLRNRKSVL